ncbi:MAG: helix-turn-helix domain-containing protein, partial [Planctomycetota bacterium]
MSYLSLDEAAAKLGVAPDRLVELRSQGQIRGFRDGSSWKFPESEIERLAEDLAADDGFGSGILVDESGTGAGSIIGGEGGDEGQGSDLNIGGEATSEGGSDVNLVTEPSGTGSDVALVASDSGIDSDEDSVFDTDEGDLMEIDSAELKLDEPAMLRDSNDSIDIAIDPKEGSTGPVAKADIKEAADKLSISDVDITDEASEDDFALVGNASLGDEDSDELMLGEESDSLDIDAINEDLKSKAASQSSLELMSGLEDGSTDKPMKKSSAGDVLSELDLIGAEQSGGGSDLITG